MFHLFDSLFGAAISFLGWPQPCVFVFLCAHGATKGILIIPGFHGFYRLSYLVSWGLFGKGSGKILLKMGCRFLWEDAQEFAVPQISLCLLLSPLTAHKEIWCCFRCLGFFNEAKKFSSEKYFYLYFLVNLGVLVQRSSTGVLVCVAEPPSHCQAGFAGWINFQVCVHFCNTNDINTCLGRRPQPWHRALETILECQISFGKHRGSLRAELCATSSGSPALQAWILTVLTSLCFDFPQELWLWRSLWDPGVHHTCQGTTFTSTATPWSSSSSSCRHSRARNKTSAARGRYR